VSSLACTERANVRSVHAGLDNSLGTMSAAARNLPNCRLGLARDLRLSFYFLSDLSRLQEINSRCEIYRGFSLYRKPNHQV